MVGLAGFPDHRQRSARVLFGIPEADLGRPAEGPGDLLQTHRPEVADRPASPGIVGRSSRRASSSRGPTAPRSWSTSRHPDRRRRPLAGTVINVFDVSPQVKLRADLEQSRQDRSRTRRSWRDDQRGAPVDGGRAGNDDRRELQATNDELETLNEEPESTNAEPGEHQHRPPASPCGGGRTPTSLLAITGNIEVGAAVLTGPAGSRSGTSGPPTCGGRARRGAGQPLLDSTSGSPTDELQVELRCGRARAATRVTPSSPLPPRRGRGRQIRRRVIAHTLGDGVALTVVVVMEEPQVDKAAKPLRARPPSSRASTGSTARRSSPIPPPRWPPGTARRRAGRAPRRAGS